MQFGGYSDTLHEQAIGLQTQDLDSGAFKTEIVLRDNALASTPISMFEVKYAEKDIRVRVA
jgi:hypothetical protein